MTTSPEDLVAEVVTAPAGWPAEVHELARRALVDTLAVGVAGSRSRAVRVAAATVNPAAEGPAPRSPWWADHRAYHVADAAYLAGTATHGMDWDDYMHPMHGHCSAVLLATVFPLAEALDADGPALVDAYLTGYQVDWLVSLALSHAHYRRGWHATSTIGVLGAAAAASRLLGLDRAEAGAALGVAASLASGVRVNFGTTTKASHGGHAARSGTQAALLARAGATSSPRWLTGPAGMIETFGGQFPAKEAARQVAGGVARGCHGRQTPWGLVQKPYACCGSVHGAVDALLEALDQRPVATGDIESVVAHVDPHVTAIMRHERPRDEHEARYSPTWVLAAATVDRAAGPAQFDEAAVRRDDIHELRERVRVLPDLVVGDDDRFAGRVEVHTRHGVLRAEVTEARGHPRRPLVSAELEAKARAALRLAVSEGAVPGLWGHVASVVDRPARTVGDGIRSILGTDVDC